jgi:hypothetical protein
MPRRREQSEGLEVQLKFIFGRSLDCPGDRPVLAMATVVENDRSTRGTRRVARGGAPVSVDR